MNCNSKKKKEVNLAHFVREVDVQSSHPGSSPHWCRFGFILFQKIYVVGLPLPHHFKKSSMNNFIPMNKGYIFSNKQTM
jgi:hypothetical protein